MPDDELLFQPRCDELGLSREDEIVFTEERFSEERLLSCDEKAEPC